MVGSQLQVAVTSYAEQFWSAPIPWHPWCTQRGLTPDIVSKYKLGWVGTPQPGHERFTGTLCIPYFSGMGTPIGVRFRHPDGHKPKYDQPKHQALALYGVDQVENRKVCLTEGELDALILRGQGYPAVGVPGAQTFKAHPEWRYLFRDCERVFLAFDGDDAGRRASDGIARIIQEVTRVSIVVLPDHKDVTDIYVENGPQGIVNLLAEASY